MTGPASRTPAPEAARPERRRAWWRWVISLALTVLLLSLFFRGKDLGQMARNVLRVEPGWILLGLGLQILHFWFRALRWRLLLASVKVTRRWNLFSAVTLGYLFNSLLPARVGEVVRPVVLARREGISKAYALGTVGLERLMDLGGVALFVMAYLIGMRWDPALVRGDGTDQLLTRVGWVAGIGLLGIILCLGAAIRWRRRLGRLYERRVPARWRASSLGLGVVRFAESFHALRSGRALGAGLGWTAAIWVIITGSLWTFLQAYGIPLSFYSTLVILGAATLGVAFPTPGGVGGVQLTLSFTLVQLFGVATETADAAAVGFQALVLVPSILIGLPFLWREGLGWWTAGSRLPEVVT